MTHKQPPVKKMLNSDEDSVLSLKTLVTKRGNGHMNQAKITNDNYLVTFAEMSIEQYKTFFLRSAQVRVSSNNQVSYNFARCPEEKPSAH